MFNPHRHREIIAAKMLPVFIRGAELVDGVASESQKHGTGDRTPFMLDGDKEPVATIDDVSLNV